MIRTGQQELLDSAMRRVARGREMTRALLMDQPSPPSDLTQPLLDAVALFESLGIAYALAGGVASMVYGRARYTEDVDFVAQADHEAILQANAEAMKRHGFDPGSTWKLYHRSGAQIDLWKDAHSDEIVQRAVPNRLGGKTVLVVEMHDLIAMKLRAGRPQDDYDISEIIKHQTIDADTIRSRVTPEQFAVFEKIKARVATN